MAIPVCHSFIVEDIPMPQFMVILSFQIHPNDNYRIELFRLETNLTICNILLNLVNSYT